MLHVHALHVADPFREPERLGLAERRGREPPTILLPDHRGVEAFLDRRPDGERRRERVARGLEVGPVANTDLVDAAEQMVRRIPCGDVGEPRLDAAPDEGQLPALLPRLRDRELVVPQLLADEFVWRLRVRLRERHGHVDVRGAGIECALEDPRDEARIRGVQEHVAPVCGGDRSDIGRIGGIDLRGHEPAVRPKRSTTLLARVSSISANTTRS